MEAEEKHYNQVSLENLQKVCEEIVEKQSQEETLFQQQWDWLWEHCPYFMEKVRKAILNEVKTKSDNF